MATLTPPLKWHGGKSYLAKKFVELMPPHLHYVETHFGGGAVLLERDPGRDWMKGHDEWADKSFQRGCSEVVNDIHSELTNFWRVLQDVEKFDRFKRIVDAIPFSVVEWQEHSQATSDDPVQSAVHFFVRHRQSMSGRGKSFAPYSKTRTRGRRNEQTNAWWGCIDGLGEIRERLQGVAILNDCATKVIKQQDGKYTLFYSDPPYLQETRVTTGEYDFEMTRDEHVKLLESLAGIQGRFMLSGYPSELYLEWEQREGWNRHEFAIDNKSSSAKTKQTMTECIWCNF